MTKIYSMILIMIILAGCQTDTGDSINRGTVRQAEKIIGLDFSNSERDSLLEDLSTNLTDFQKIREQKIDNSIPPALNFNPLPLNFRPPTGKSKFILGTANRVNIPENIQNLAFYSVRDLGVLIRTKKISSVELTKFFIDRLKKYDSKLHCVITITEELALKEAKRADKELAAGKYRGPLHGIPYGAKDLLAKKGYKTTWGSMPYKNQVINEDATVISKLHDAGAVLVAKMTLGALAWGDVWYGEKTRNPWNLEQGSSGSSAGSASATAGQWINWDQFAVRWKTAPSYLMQFMDRMVKTKPW